MGMNNSKILITMGAGVTTGMFLYILYGSTSKFRMRNRKQKPVMGLRNSGSTCFLNAVLQAVASCNHFIQWLAHKDDANRADFPPRIPDSYTRLHYPIIAVIYRAILVINREIENDDDRFMDKVPGDIIGTLRHQGHRFITTEEQDTYEFFQFIMGALSKEVENSIRRQQKGSLDCLLDEEDTSDVSGELISISEIESLTFEPVISALNSTQQTLTEDASSGGWSIVNDPTKSINRIFSTRKIIVDGSYRAAPRSPLQGMTITQLQCLHCLHNTPFRLEPFNSVTLMLPDGDAGDSLTVSALLGDYLKTTIVTQVDCEGCAKIQGRPTKSAFSKETFIARLPPTLCLHVLRASWCGEVAKRTEFVRFPEHLNLSSLKRHYDRRPSIEAACDEAPSSDAKERTLRKFRDCQYRLVSVVSHVGDPEFGHFMTFRRGPSKTRSQGSEEWYYVSDECVESVPLMEVLQTKAYMLFYEKVYVNPALAAS